MRPGNIALVTSACLLIAGSLAGAQEKAEVNMRLKSSGASQKLGYYMPQACKLSSDKPAELKKAPDAAAPLYGTIQFGGKSHILLLDEPQDKDPTLYIDKDGTGELTKDSAAKWEKKTLRAGNQSIIQYSGSFTLPIGAGDKRSEVTLQAYRFDKNNPRFAGLKDKLFYYRDYAVDGDIVLNSAKYHATLSDETASGDFASSKAVFLLIDLNADGRFDPRNERYDAHKPFNIKGTTWEISDLKPDGSFQIRKSNQTVAEIMPPPDLSVGKVIPSFKATKMDGTALNFPADYKGKLVMLDFWATWCGPCMQEVPGLVTAYNEVHPKGLEVLGISLDQPKAEEKIKQVTTEKGMTWPQVYDGKFWKAAVAEQYGIQSIPAPFLVDGDTGKILAAGNSLRGEKLLPTLKSALEKKQAEKVVQ